MTYAQWYEDSPIGRIYLTSNGTELTGLWFDTHQKYWKALEGDELVDLPVFDQTRAWLDTYFAGKDPGEIPPINLDRVSPFRRMVCEEMCRIGYGELTTYGEIAKALAKRTGKNASARAVGGGVGHNPISIIIPCHRVIGAGGNLTGYGGGMRRKIALLELEGFDMADFKIPTKGTAL
ncbi:MAG: methylated-DNA--[protein]-cysteine S-methyltransferase [bacterium]|nr:methylated-DNA--[protein]-cysteine S-methyltransferase [bacterium]